VERGGGWGGGGGGGGGVSSVGVRHRYVKVSVGGTR